MRIFLYRYANGNWCWVNSYQDGETLGHFKYNSNRKNNKWFNSQQTTSLSDVLSNSWEELI